MTGGDMDGEEYREEWIRLFGKNLKLIITDLVPKGKVLFMREEDVKILRENLWDWRKGGNNLSKETEDMVTIFKEFVFPGIKKVIMESIESQAKGICVVCRRTIEHIGVEPRPWIPCPGQKRAEVCPVCRGKGKVPSVICSDPLAEAMEINHETCHGCGGRGWVEVG